MLSSCHKRGIKKKTPSPYQESHFKSFDSALQFSASKQQRLYGEYGHFFVSHSRQDEKVTFLYFFVKLLIDHLSYSVYSNG